MPLPEASVSNTNGMEELSGQCSTSLARVVLGPEIHSSDMRGNGQYVL